MSLHPVVERMLQAQVAAGRPPVSSLPVHEARALFSSGRAALGEGPQVHAVSDRNLKGRSGHDIRLRVIEGSAAPQQLVVYFHGGGWVLGEIEDFDALGRTLAQRSNSVLVLVDYRLAPEHPFPAAVHDAEDAVLHAARELAPAFGRALPLVIAGDSAGGNLAAVVSLTLRHQLPIALQVLFNPVTDVEMATSSYVEYAQGYTLTAPDMRWFFDHYAPRRWPEADPLIAPLRAEDLAGAPPAWIGTAEFDVLRDEGERYARRLEQAGVPVSLRRFEGLPHGFARWFALVDTADQAVQQAADAIRAASPPFINRV